MSKKLIFRDDDIIYIFPKDGLDGNITIKYAGAGPSIIIPTGSMIRFWNRFAFHRGEGENEEHNKDGLCIEETNVPADGGGATETIQPQEKDG